MVYRGIVKNGVVVLSDGAKIPEGTEVRVEPLARAAARPDQGRTLAEQFADIIGTVPDLPPDMADRHDHHLRAGVPCPPQNAANRQETAHAKAQRRQGAGDS
jgi:hypothetical protein